MNLPMPRSSRTGEFFEIAPDEAHTTVKALLVSWGEVDENGQSYEEKKLIEKQREKEEKQMSINLQKRTQKNLLYAISKFRDLMELPAQNAFNMAREAAEPKGFFAFFKSPNEQLRKEVYKRELLRRTQSIRQAMNMPWLLEPPLVDSQVTYDICFAVGPNGAGRISFEEYNHHWESWKRYKRHYWDTYFKQQEQQEAIRQGKIKVADRKFYTVGDWQGDENIIKRFGCKSNVYRIPKDAILSPSSNWRIRDRNLINMKTNKSYGNFESFTYREVEAPKLTVIPTELTVIIGEIASDASASVTYPI